MTTHTDQQAEYWVITRENNPDWFKLPRSESEGPYTLEPVPEYPDINISSLGLPDVVLYANRSPETIAAFDALVASGERFRVVPAPRKRRPVATWGGLTFRGIDKISHLIDIMRGIGNILVDSLAQQTPNWGQADPRHRLAVEALAQREHEIGRRILAHVFADQPGARSRKRSGVAAPSGVVAAN